MFPLFISPVFQHQKKITVLTALVLFLYSMGREGESLDISSISVKHALCRHKVTEQLCSQSQSPRGNVLYQIGPGAENLGICITRLDF